MEREFVCPQCGHASSAEPAMTSLWLHRLLGTGAPLARCPVVWDDDDCGLPPDPCGCTQSIHAA